MKSKILTATLVGLNIINCVLMVCLVCVGYRTYNYPIQFNNDTVIVKTHHANNGNKTQSTINPINSNKYLQSIKVDIVDTSVDETTTNDVTEKVEVIETTPVQLKLVSDTNNVTKISNATPEELNKAIQKSCRWMYEYNPNIGKLYYDLEQKHGINAYFALAVSFSEVGVRRMSNLAQRDNNIYGLLNGDSYDSIEECVDYFFRLIRKHYVGQGRMSVEDISQKYCLGDPVWIDNVSFYMNALPNRSR